MDSISTLNALRAVQTALSQVATLGENQTVMIFNQDGTPAATFKLYEFIKCFQVAAQALAEQQAAIDALVKMFAENLGDIKADNLDMMNIPKVVGAPLYSQGSGAPSFVPKFIGQEYLDTTSGTLYKAKAVTNSTNDWQSTK